MSDFSLQLAKDVGRLEGAGIAALRDMESVKDVLTVTKQDDPLVKLALRWLVSSMETLANSLQIVEQHDIERYGEELLFCSDIVAKYATKKQ